MNKRTYKCLDCKHYDVNINRDNRQGYINRICVKNKNDPRIIVDLDAKNCNDYEYKINKI